MDAFKKYIQGAYENKLTVPVKPTEPAVLRKRAGVLTAAEQESLPEVIRAYEAEKKAYETARVAYNAESGRLMAQAQADLEADHGIVGNPKADMLWSKAWDRGHAYGLGEVISIYGDLVDLVK